ncbi:MAG: MarR family winged helix-turn-helix transcriptional regulator [Gemmatimonadota bacterium]|jgi:DNA-binding MarR family transcriptional regulator
MSDIASITHAYPRIAYACRPRHIVDPGTGARVSAHQAEILSYLDGADPTMVGELAAHVGVTPSTMSITLKRLEEGGYVRRDRDPADRRVINVRLTAAGERVRDARTVLEPERVAAMLSLLSPEERTEAVRGLALLAEAAEALVRRDRTTVANLTGDGL